MRRRLFLVPLDMSLAGLNKKEMRQCLHTPLEDTVSRLKRTMRLLTCKIFANGDSSSAFALVTGSSSSPESFSMPSSSVHVSTVKQSLKK